MYLLFEYSLYPLTIRRSQRCVFRLSRSAILTKLSFYPCVEQSIAELLHNNQS